MRGFVMSQIVLMAAVVMLCATMGYAQTPIRFGENRLDEVGSCNGGSDTFTFEADIDDRVTVRVVECVDFSILCRNPTRRVGFEPCVELRDPIDMLIGRECGGNQARIASETVMTAGDHSIIVSDSDGQGAGRYNLFFQRLNNPGKTEPLSSGDNLLGQLSCGEVDTYTFAANPGAQATINMFPDAIGDVDPRLELYNDRGQPVALPGSGSIEATLNAGGIFTLLAFSSGAQEGTYRIRLSITSAPIGGSVTGFTPVAATCLNITTQRQVVIPLEDGTSSWNCEEAGFIAGADDDIATGATTVLPPE